MLTFVFDIPAFTRGPWWPIEEIDANLGRSLFTPNFESEYRMIRSALLALL